jgi:hypothetical protein
MVGCERRLDTAVLHAVDYVYMARLEIDTINYYY